MLEGAKEWPRIHEKPYYPYPDCLFYSEPTAFYNALGGMAFHGIVTCKDPSKNAVAASYFDDVIRDGGVPSLQSSINTYH